MHIFRYYLMTHLRSVQIDILNVKNYYVFIAEYDFHIISLD